MIISKKTPKKEILRLGSHCEKSNHCCSFTSGFLAPDDLTRIAQFFGMKKQEVKEKYLEEVEIFNKKALRPKRDIKDKDRPYGACVFLDEKGCKIHDVKPLHCKVYTCKPFGFQLTQWFYLNYLLDTDDPEAIRQYAQFLQTNDPIPGGHLEELVPDKEKLDKILDYSILKQEREEE
ncbi:MAG: hypothetical protein MAG795_00846 [Candidatus Woesearchaeota archaeon]|nr:hypothetical protein [Candidatus Woesearchaeota archaeon]